MNNNSMRNPPTLGDATMGLLSDWGNRIESGLLTAFPVLAESDPSQWANRLLEDGVGIGSIAWHGSPHKFIRPDLSKMGTGEGAQAYGHGFYSAEARRVGEEYKRKLMGGTDKASQIAATHLNMYKTPKAAAEVLRADLTPNLTPEAKQVTQNAIDILNRGGANTGYLYKMDIPDETIGKMLDWDKPLSEQSDAVKYAFKNTDKTVSGYKRELGLLNDKYPPETNPGGTFDFFAEDWFGNKMSKEDRLRSDQLYGMIEAHEKVSNSLNITKKANDYGESEYRALTKKLGSDKSASEYLNSLGIPGIKYLDGNSRAAGQGSRNFVSFTPDHIEMLERNGVPMMGLLNE